MNVDKRLILAGAAVVITAVALKYFARGSAAAPTGPSRRTLQFSVVNGVEVVGKFNGALGTPLFYRSYTPTSHSEQNVVVVMVHGMGDHSAHALTVTQALVDVGLPVFAYDHRGHGKSPGPRGHFDTWEHLMSDLHNACEAALEKHPNRSIVLFGNSWGGLQVIDFIRRPDRHPQVVAAVVNAPALDLSPIISSTMNTAIHFIRFFSPRYSLSDPLPGSMLCSDPQKQRENDEDDLIHSFTSVNFLAEILDAGARVRRDPARVAVPVLLTQGVLDQLINVQGNLQFFEQLRQQKNSPMVEIFTVADGQHETFNDLNRGLMLCKVTEFIESHVS